MRTPVLIAAAVLGTALLAVPGGAQQRKQILTVQSVLQDMEARLKKVKDVQADYELVNGAYRSSGRLFYMTPYYLRINSNTDGSQIVTDGQFLWIYLPAYGVVAEQDLVKSEQERQVLLMTTQKNLHHLKRDYSFTFAPGGKDAAEHWIMDLAPRITKIGFKQMRMWVTRETGFIARVEAVTINGKQVSIAFRGVVFDQGPPTITKGLFWFGMPDANVQVIRNTILPIDIFDSKRSK